MGTVVVQVSLDPEGQVVHAAVVLSSGHTDFDNAAMDAWYRMSLNGVRVPPPQSLFAEYGGYAEISEPITFSIKPSAPECEDQARMMRQTFSKALDLGRRAAADFQRGDYDQAITHCTQALDIASIPELWAKRARAEQMQGRLDRAEADFTSAIESSPVDSFAYDYRGLIYLSKDQRDRALADFNQALTLNPKFPKAYSDRARVLWVQGDKDKALEDYSKVIELAPNSSVGYSERAKAEVSMGKGDQALVDYGRLIQLAPDVAWAYNDRAWAYHRLGRSAEGLADANHALTLQPHSAHIFDTRAHLYEDLGEREKAIADYEAALTIDPALTTSQDGLKRLHP